MLRLPIIAGGLVVYFAARAIARRRAQTLVRLRDGRRVKLLSSVALVNGDPSDLLALEYRSRVPESDTEAMTREARSLLEAVARRAEYAGCRSALVTVRPKGRGKESAGIREQVFAFRRGQAGAEWQPTAALE
ncbi:MAG TPA: hypothetical protein VG500_04160 [Gemmatimonadales bacterium]|nr:hypothetical protein [Gemmatimonadales bacterium]